jgi:hypothetical protein
MEPQKQIGDGEAMNKGDIAKIHRVPMAGMEITLKRHDAANKAWHGVLLSQPLPGEVLVFDYELAETIERKAPAGRKAR